MVLHIALRHLRHDVPRAFRKIGSVYHRALCKQEEKGMNERPDWLDDETKIPPYPILRCPRCKALFDDYSIHICASKNKPTGSSRSSSPI